MNMNGFSKSVGLVTKVLLVGSSVALLGAACWKGVGTNTNVGLGNAEVNVNVSANMNVNTNSSGDIDTSDWLTYTNEEYGFSFRYPQNWTVTEQGEADEGGMGVSSGTTIISSDECRIFGDAVKEGTVIRMQSEQPDLTNIVSEFQIQGVKYYDIVNENGDKGYIYIYAFSDNEIRFVPVDNSSNQNCESTLDQIMSTVSSIS